MQTETANFIAALPCGYLNEKQLKRLAELDRLCLCLVRLGGPGGRFIAAAQDVAQLIQYCEAAGDYVRDVSVTSDSMRKAERLTRTPPPTGHIRVEFREEECGGVFDGNAVWSDTELGGAPGF